LAGSTCQRYYSDGSEFSQCAACCAYIRDFFRRCTVTTVRDRLAKIVLNTLGHDATVIPCSSIFAVDEYALKSEDGDYVVLSYIPVGGHYDFGQNIDKTGWASTLSDFHKIIAKHERAVFACHDKKEGEAVRAIAAGAEIFIAKDFVEYMKFYARAKFGIMNRVHGAFMLAAFGRPSVIIGSDTRARMGGGNRP
jgi:hypothetical protein